MTSDVNMDQQAIHDQFESQMKTAEAKLETLKAQTETATKSAEAEAIATLEPRKREIQQKMQELKKSGGERWQQAKADVEGRIAEFENSVNRIESQAKAR